MDGAEQKEQTQYYVVGEEDEIAKLKYILTGKEATIKSQKEENELYYSTLDHYVILYRPNLLLRYC